MILIAGVLQNLCSWSVDKLTVKNSNNNSSSVAWIPVVALVGGTAAVSTTIVLATRVKSLRKEKKALKRRVIELEVNLNNSGDANRHRVIIEHELRVARDKIFNMEREIERLLELNVKAQADEREVRNQLVTMTSVFADEYQRNQAHDEETLLRDIAQRDQNLPFNTRGRITEVAE